jgi:hypothetical protein
LNGCCSSSLLGATNALDEVDMPHDEVDRADAPDKRGNGIYQRIADATGKPLDAVLLVELLLENLTRRRAANGPRMSAREFCEAMLRCDGNVERTVGQLKVLQRERSEDIGLIVAGLIAEGTAALDEGDSMSDFVGIFDLRTDTSGNPQALK